MKDFLFYALAFAVLLGVLIVVHEFGHYLVARLAGVKILRFSVGFGRPLLLWRAGRDRTEWTICAVPLGGYVRMLDEGEGDVRPEEAPRAFNRQSVWKRIAIVAAGPLANLLLATVLYWGLFMYGTEELRPVLGQPAQSSPAERAGVQNGEKVLRIDGQGVETWSDLRWQLLRLMVEKDTTELEVVNDHHEIAFRRLDLTAARTAEAGTDPIASLGLRFFRPIVPAVLGDITPGSAAATAGMRAGDRIAAIDGKPVASWMDVVQTVRAAPDIPLRFELLRAGRTVDVVVTPASMVSGGVEIGRIGAAVADPDAGRENLIVTVAYGPFVALGKAAAETWDKSWFSLQMMGKMLTGVLSWRNISGPVTIADYAGQSAKLGATHYFRFMALVSISLAVLNLLPIPMLDGGHLLYYVAEILRGRPLPDSLLVIGQKIGLTVVMLLMAFALYNDFTRMIPG